MSLQISYETRLRWTCLVLPNLVQLKSTKVMIKRILLLTFALILGAVFFEVLISPGTDAVAAREDVTSGCPLRQVALDEGYGITRTEMRPVCRNK